MNKNNICYVVGGGENYGLPIRPQTGDLVIAADAGLLCLEAQGVNADYIIGDFDSLSYVPQSPNVTVLSPEKNVTDMSAAIQIGIEHGYDRFHIYGGTGGRIDHSIANSQLLAQPAIQRRQGFLFEQGTVITAIHNHSLAFDAVPAGYVSVFAHSDRAEGVYLKGLKYELNCALLNNAFPLGVSNEFIGTKSSITVENGTLLVVFPITALNRLLLC